LLEQLIHHYVAIWPTMKMSAEPETKKV